MTADRMLQLMSKAEDMIREAVHEAGFYMDDQGWGDDLFRIGIWNDYEHNGKYTPKEVTSFWFHYNEDEEFCGTDEEQLGKAVEEFLEELDDYMEQYEY